MFGLSVWPGFGGVVMNIEWVAIQKGKYIIPWSRAGIPVGWIPCPDLSIFETIIECRAAINEYADENNLISSFVTPKLHRESVKKWEQKKREDDYYGD